MDWESVESFLDGGGSGERVIKVVDAVRADAELKARLRDEVMALAGAAEDALMVFVDHFLLDDFLHDRLDRKRRAMVLSALSQDLALLEELRKIYEADCLAASYEPDDEDDEPPDVVHEDSPKYVTAEGADAVPLVSITASADHWRIRELDPGLSYDIRPRSGARLEGGTGRWRLADEAVITGEGNTRCAVSLSAGKRRLELQFMSVRLTKERFESAAVFLEAGGKAIQPSSRVYGGDIAAVIFEGLDPRIDYELRVAPDLISR